MSTHGLPYYFEDTTGLACGPTDFLDIYDRPPFLRLSTSTSHSHRSPARHGNSLNTRSRPGTSASDSPSEPRTLKIFELASRTVTTTRSPSSQQQQQHHHHQRQDHRESGTTGTPSAVLALDEGRGVVGSIKFRGGTAVALERWLKKSSTFGSSLTRQFKASDGMYYQWSFRSVQDYEWTCVQLATNHLVAHYVVRSSEGSAHIYHQTSGNVLTVQEECVHLSVEFLASLIVMRHIRAQSSYIERT